METKNSRRPKIVMARIYVDDPDVIFAYNGMFWFPMKRKDVEDVVVPMVIVVANGKKYVCRDTTLKEALNYEKCV